MGHATHRQMPRSLGSTAHWESDGIEELHHGQCVGADAVAHRAAVEIGIPVVVHPPTNPRLMAQDVVKRPGVTFLAAEPYLNRNRNIVDQTDALLALPSEPESNEGGTWYTVHFAQRMNKPVVICYKHGEVEQRGELLK